MARQAHTPHSPDGWLSSDGFPIGDPLGRPADSAQAEVQETDPTGSGWLASQGLISPDPEGPVSSAPRYSSAADSHGSEPAGSTKQSDPACGPPSTFARIYAVVRRIPRGRVATYGQVALLAGNPRWARVVGYALHVNPDPQGIPCYRVVNRLGGTSSAFAFGGEDQQRRLLEGDGVAFTADGRVDLSRFLWDGK